MAQCDSNSLVASATCYDCGIPTGMQQPVIIYLLCQIAGVAPDPNALVAAASCLNCGLPDGIQRFIIMQLLCQIVNGGAPVPSLSLKNQALNILTVSGWTGTQTVYMYSSIDFGATWQAFFNVTAVSPQGILGTLGRQYFASLNSARTAPGPGDSNTVSL